MPGFDGKGPNGRQKGRGLGPCGRGLRRGQNDSNFETQLKNLERKIDKLEEENAKLKNKLEKLKDK